MKQALEQGIFRKTNLKINQILDIFSVENNRLRFDFTPERSFNPVIA
jgi:hypothetical protein